MIKYIEISTPVYSDFLKDSQSLILKVYDETGNIYKLIKYPSLSEEELENLLDKL